MSPDRNDPLRVDPDADPVAEQVFEHLAVAVQAVELPAAQRSALRESVLGQARDYTPPGTLTVRAASLGWTALSASVHIKVLRCDPLTGNQTTLMRVSAGGTIPRHRHAQEEEFIVLEGECHIGSLRLGAGDVHIAAAGSWHEEITTRTGTMVLVRGEYPPPAAILAMLRPRP